jgi:DNA (cytosine-5)-methyltransferase 1
MRRVRGSHTAPEVAFRKALWAKGLRFRTCDSGLPGKPDVVLPSKKVAVFVDGDFWHGNQWRRRNLRALEEQFEETSSKEYWLKKIRRNMQRDCEATASLENEGWTVLRFWESDIKKNIEDCAQTVFEAASNGKLRRRNVLLAGKTFAEFFAGIGLMRLGLETQGWTSVFANDRDPRKQEIYEAQFGSDSNEYRLGDVHALKAKDVPDLSLATASFPCNDLSLAGSMKGLAGKQSSALWGFVRVLEEMKSRKPPLVLLENVTGFLSSHRGADFEAALLALNRLGYTVDAFILDAVNFVPQSRRRLFVVGALDPRGPVSVAEEIESAVRPKALIDFIRKHPDIGWRLRPLPEPPDSALKLESILEDLPEDAPQWWSRERAEYLLDQMSPLHRATAKRMIRSRLWSYGAVFRRIRKGKSMAELRTDGIAGCLRTPKGGSAKQILFKAGKGKYAARYLTPRECARLMGADDFKISVPDNQALFGFGDAVCVPVIEWIAKYYLNPLVNESIRVLVRAGGLRSR